MKSLTSLFSSKPLLIFAIILLAGCGDKDQPPASTTTETITPSSRDNPVPDANTDTPDAAKTDKTVQTPSAPTKKQPATTGSFSGTVKFVGEIPELPPILAQNPNGQNLAVCTTQPISDESLVVNPNNKGIANVFVYIKDAPENAVEINSPETPVIFDQKVCQFIPHAMFIPAGSKVNAINSDAIAHNIHTYPIRNAPINQLIQANDQMGINVEYPDAEILPHKIGCDIHPWMTAWHLVLDHPYGVVTDENGNFTIKDLPPGTHNFRIWHEKVGYLEKDYEVTIEADQENKVSLEYPAETFAEEE